MSSKAACCRYCGAPLKHSFCDLGVSPLANSYLTENQQDKMEPFYPLHAYVCAECFLVQLQEFESPENIFKHYAYFSSYSDTWLQHCEHYSNIVIDKFCLTPDSLVVEIASNDGYMLQYFKRKGINVIGVEPAENVAQVAINSGIETIIGFFNHEFAEEMLSQGKVADLLIANNVLAHVPDVNSFVSGLKIILKPDGIVTIEFPHLVNLIKNVQFDTIYHEHFSYFSFLTAKNIFNKHGLEIFDVEELSTHGGSLRVYLKHIDNNSLTISDSVARLLDEEKAMGIDKLHTYMKFIEKVNIVKNNLLKFLISAKEEHKSIVAYGAAAKGNTLLNYSGIKTDFIDYAVDRNPDKQNKYLPGSRIPVFDIKKIKETKPDYVLILPWNLSDEICRELAFIETWGGRFVTPIPRVEIFS